MVVLRCVDHWVHKSHLVYKHTRNCVLCGAGDDKLKQVGLEEKRAERLLFRAESVVISKSLPPQQLERFLQTGRDLVEHRQVRQFDKVQV